MDEKARMQAMSLWAVQASVAGAVAGCTVCFAAGTRISVPGGSRPIGELRPGEVVEAWLDGALVRRRILKVHHGRASLLLDLRTPSTTIRGITPGHRLADPVTGGWRTAGELTEGDLVRVRTPWGAMPEPVSEIVTSPGPAVDVYNLTLDGEGGFFAAGVVAGQKVVASARPVRRPALAAATLLLGMAGASALGETGAFAPTTGDTASAWDTAGDTGTTTDPPSGSGADTGPAGGSGKSVQEC